MLENGDQKALLQIGRNGCYFLCILKLCENITGKSIDVIAAYKKCVESGMITDECFVNDPRPILYLYTHKSFDVAFFPAGYENDGRKYVIAEWNLKDGAKVQRHFTIHTPKDETAFEPFGNSPVCKHGRIVSYRVFNESRT